MMNFTQQLRKKRDAKVTEFAKDFLEKVKPLLEKSAEEGYSRYSYVIESEQDKANLYMFESEAFIEYLRNELKGMLIFYGALNHLRPYNSDFHPSIIFSWDTKGE